MLITDTEYDSFFAWLEEQCEKLNKMNLEKQDFTLRCELQRSILEKISNNLNMFDWEVAYNFNNGIMIPTGIYALYLDEKESWFDKLIVRGMEPTTAASYTFGNLVLSIQASKTYRSMQIGPKHYGTDMSDLIKSLKIVKQPIKNYYINPIKVKEPDEKEETQKETN